MSKWPMVKMGEVLAHCKEFVQIDDFTTYKRCRVRLHAQGVVLRDAVPGSEVKTKRQQPCRTGEFLVAEIDAKVGGYGIVPSDLDGAIVGSHYFLFEVEPAKLDRDFLGYYIRTPGFQEQVQAQGSTNYAAIRPSHVLDYQIPLPPLSEQRRLVERLDALAAKVEEASTEATGIEKRSADLLMSAYHRITADSPTKPLGDVAPLVRRPAVVDPSASYPSVSVRSFGRGTFHNPPMAGSDITWEKPHLVLSGDILISNIKAWEGAIAVAGAGDDNHYGSHRYLTYVPMKGIATARFLCFHLLTPEGLAHVGDASPGTADRNRTLSARALLQAPVPVPTYEQQLWFGLLHDRFAEIRRTQSQSAAQLTALLPAILDRAFKGEL